MSTDLVPGLYRTTDLQHLDWDGQGTIRPRRWVESSIAWPSVVSAIDNRPALVELAKQRDNLPPPVSLEKLVAEAVFERIRARIAPDAPSRLNCVFVALDAYDAVDFAALSGQRSTFDPATGMPLDGPISVPVSTGGRPWIAVDMRLFSAHERTATAEPGLVAQLDDLAAKATDYWSGRSGPNPFFEILVEAVDMPGHVSPDRPPGSS